MFSNRSLGVLIASAAAFGATTMIAAPPAQADGPYVAMAYAPSSGDVYTVSGPSSRTTAEQEALNDCQKKHGDCKMVGSTDKCMALVYSSEHYDVAYGDTAGQAVSAAQAKISGGQTTKGYCASGT